MDEDSIEAKARAAYEAANKSGGLQMPWAAQSEKVRERWRQTLLDSDAKLTDAASTKAPAATLKRS
ncbi:hypothetical protein [uncultured Phenylobacterium sp.]|uniref:hypothetical protein n=1 Tax=uncultured Phenylobacterium sp. TaxID=349273 RepID=UPI0025EBF3DD|nr:hypothetical protein [uncultured Phenylobacterium sp.]